MSFHAVGGFGCSDITIKKNKLLIQQSRLAPSLSNALHLEMGYTPCRLWKNISYGKMGLTNNGASQEAFNNKLICSRNLEELYLKGLDFDRRPDKNDIIKDLMREVRDKHTYINRAKGILWSLNNLLQ
jgi:hypothetical protein